MGAGVCHNSGVAVTDPLLDAPREPPKRRRWLRRTLQGLAAFVVLGIAVLLIDGCTAFGGRAIRAGVHPTAGTTGRAAGAGAAGAGRATRAGAAGAR